MLEEAPKCCWCRSAKKEGRENNHTHENPDLQDFGMSLEIFICLAGLEMTKENFQSKKLKPSVFPPLKGLGVARQHHGQQQGHACVLKESLRGTQPSTHHHEQCDQRKPILKQ